MTLTGGFYSEEHEANFYAARKRSARGGEDSQICGARTRAGGVCRQPPLKGGHRCIRHCGWKAARAHRERQLCDLALGRITFEAFAHAEAKRAVNRLREAWKKNPWYPGRTIDLGAYEARFLTESGIARLETPVAPAVIDWLRWRFRRLRLDRQRNDEWGRVLREDYPRRVRDAGPQPASVSTDDAEAERAAPLWTAERLSPTSKRQRRDAPRAKAEREPRQLRERAAPATLDQNGLARMVAEHHATLAPLLAKCRGDDEQRTLILALHDYLSAPEDRAAGAHWRGAVNELWSRG